MPGLRVHFALLAALLGGLVGGLCAGPAAAQLLMSEPPEEVRGLDVIERLGEQVPFDAQLINSDGQTVELGEYFKPGPDGRKIPVILALVYYGCPVACPATMTAISNCLNGLDYTVGVDYRVVIVSFDPTNTPEQAREEEIFALTRYNQPKTPDIRAGYRFHTAKADESRRIADAVGFEYRYLPAVGEYGHPSAIFILSPEGTISRYMYGSQFFPGQMRLALLDASEGRIARGFGDKFLRFCYSFDSSTGTYTVQAWAIMRVVGAVTVFGLAGLVIGLKIYERRRRPAARPGRRASAESASVGAPAALSGGARSV